MGDSIGSEFIAYFKNLPKTCCLCRIYERNDGFCLYGEDTKFITKVLTASKIKTLGSGRTTLDYVNITKTNLIRLLRHLLFVIQYKVEILRNTGTTRSPKWTVVGKASPGNLTAVEDVLFSEDKSYVMTQRGIIAVKAVAEGSEMVLGVAHCDAVLRQIQICQFTDNPQLSMLQSVIAQLSPQECILPVVPKSKKNDPSARSIEETVKSHNIAVSEAGDFNSQFIVQDLNRLLMFDEGQDFQNTMMEEAEMTVALSCVGAIIKNLELLSDEDNFGQYELSMFRSELYAKVDMSCKIGLALFPDLKSELQDKSCLFGHINSCLTSSGERLLIQWIKQPLLDLRKLEERLDVVETFVMDPVLADKLTKLIEKFVDIELLCRKIQRHKAGLQDLYKIYQMTTMLPPLIEILSSCSGPHEEVIEENFANEIKERCEDLKNFSSMIDETLDFDAIENREFVVQAEYNESLLELRKSMNGLRIDMTADMKITKSNLGSSSLKLEVFDKLGFIYRITRKEENILRSKKNYNVVDTRTTGVRFLSPALKELNDEYNEKKKNYEDIQQEIVDQMVVVSASYVQPLRLLSNTIAWLDAALSLTRVAVNSSKTYVRPRLIRKGDCHIVLKQCRHPFLEVKVDNYIPNDVEITKENQRFYFVTGPNMGGKSTFIRSVALNVLLAQIGSFVPCDEADISLVDAFLTRIGACDMPSKSISTFMYEMLEVKNMIKRATPASLLIIDEMGRGTSTFDGFGLSWSISKHIATEIKAACLFATHFHDLTDLSKTIKTVGNLHVEALCSDADVTFLFRVKPGVCSESFGIHVARLAEFPEKVLECAEKKLKELEESHLSYKELYDIFSPVPNSEKLINMLKSFYMPEESPMEVDDSPSTSRADQYFSITPAQQHFLNKLEELARKC